MARALRPIAMLASNPALASIFASALHDAGWQSAIFSTLPGLSTYLRIAPVDVAILDVDLPWNEMVETVRALRSMPRLANPLLETIVLTHAIPLRNLAEMSRIGTVLRKPVGPGQLVAAVHEVMGSSTRPAAVRSRPRPTLHLPPPITRTSGGRREGNVISLFGEGREHH